MRQFRSESTKSSSTSCTYLQKKRQTSNRSHNVELFQQKLLAKHISFDNLRSTAPYVKSKTCVEQKKSRILHPQKKRDLPRSWFSTIHRASTKFIIVVVETKREQVSLRHSREQRPGPVAAFCEELLHGTRSDNTMLSLFPPDIYLDST